MRNLIVLKKKQRNVTVLLATPEELAVIILMGRAIIVGKLQAVGWGPTLAQVVQFVLGPVRITIPTHNKYKYYRNRIWPFNQLHNSSHQGDFRINDRAIS